ncbi:carboxymuconolactone decarboxylase family protein [Streptomyces acidicola]|uniref:carboxymuconolactone decarboxylase family protein n=1 Tax=Streptomyces acidicola TaxID=2596892 RepID=UPI00342868C7
MHEQGPFLKGSGRKSTGPHAATEGATHTHRSAYDFTRIATEHAFNDVWTRSEHLDLRTRALVEAFIQIAVYAGVARAFDSYAVAREVFTEHDEADSPQEN